MPASKSAAESFSVSLRITLVNPPSGIKWALQLGKDEIAPPSSIAGSNLSFDFSVEAKPADTSPGFRLGGPAIQGPAGSRFVYLRSGAYAGQAGSAGWRTKVPVTGITRKLVDQAAKNHRVLEARIEGSALQSGQP